MQFLRLYLALCLVCVCSLQSEAQQAVHRQEAWMAQYSPDRVFNSNGYTLIFGDFLHQVSRYSGGGVPVNPITAVEDLTWPKISGSVEVVVPDGAGGWYVGGDFGFIDTELF
jgi:hypothetical protein